MKLSAVSRGNQGEQLACDYLVNKGYRIIDRNYRIRGGEIDIIALDGTDLVFVEVKLRKSNKFGYPEESVSFAKLRRIARAMKLYLHATHIRYSCVRLDIIAITQSAMGVNITHIKDVELPYNIC